jgi:hypothetical protein
MIVKLTKEDNDIILNHLYKYNQGVETHMKMAMDSYVESIEFKSDDIIFHSKRINPILDEECNINEDNVGSGRGKIGDSVSISLSEFEKPYNDIFYAAVREIKLNKLI